MTGPLEPVKDRPWSYVAKVPTAQGILWFKENRAGSRYEPALLLLLAECVPGRVVAPIAIDAARGWSLQPDGGTILRDAGARNDVGRWEHMLSGHAQLQRDLAPAVPRLLPAGVPDLRPAALVSHVDTLELPDGYGPGLRRACAELADSPVPASLNHDDLHDGNMFISGCVFDWGDAVV